MKAIKLLVLLGMAVALPSEAHRGSEPHPTVQDLEGAALELRAAIREVERRLGERLDGLQAPATELDQRTVEQASKRAVAELADELAQSLGELNDRVEVVAAAGAALGAGLFGLSAFLGLRMRALRRRLLRPQTQGNNAQEAEANANDDAQGETEEADGESAVNRRVVTHTRKAGVQQTIEELHNPGKPWSPRRVDDAIVDILKRGILYVAVGPAGKEVEIEVRQGTNKPYLRTKPDEHDGNNLRELPDPPP